MSWTTVFPVLTDEHVDQYLNAASPADRRAIEDWFAVDRVVNSRTLPGTGQHVVASSLFWKNTRADEPELPRMSREVLLNAVEMGLVSRCAPWPHYVQPLLDGAEVLAKLRPEIVFRVYLAADLEFLADDFVARNCEIHLMKGSSIRHNPGAMWRFLALEHDGLVTVTDADRARDVIHDVERTELVVRDGLGHWRVPYIWGDNEHDCSHYRAILACQFGSAVPLPVSKLMPAMVWHTLQGTLPTWCDKGGTKIDAFGSNWPDYGFDEWFLNVAIFPRIAFGGILTFVDWKNTRLNQWFALDIEYATWANPKSEIFHFSQPLVHSLPGESPVSDGVQNVKTEEEGRSPTI